MTRIRQSIAMMAAILTLSTPASARQVSHPQGDTLEVCFLSRQTDLDLAYRGNGGAIGCFVSRLCRLGADARRGVTVTVYGGATPLGAPELNRRLGERRGESLRRALCAALSAAGLGDLASRVCRENLGARWDALRALVADSREPWRDRVLEVLDRPVDESDGWQLDPREQALRRMDGGAVWRALSADVLPRLQGMTFAVARVPAAEVAVTAAKPVPVSQPSQAPRRKAEPGWVQAVAPDSDPEVSVVVEGSIPLADVRAIGSLRTKAFNRAVLSELRNAWSAELRVPGTRIDRLSLTGYGAPTGNYRRNEVRGNARATELKEYLFGVGGEVPTAVSVSWVAEDWDSIRSLVGASRMRLRNAALDIIRSVGVADGREEQLRMLDHGSVYDELRGSVFPRVCRVEYRAVLYRTAEAVLADAPARINAAGVALTRGDLDAAARYLEGLDGDPRAYNNLGVLCLLRGDTARAVSLLRLAAAAGVPEAKAVLESTDMDIR